VLPNSWNKHYRRSKFYSTKHLVHAQKPKGCCRSGTKSTVSYINSFSKHSAAQHPFWGQRLSRSTLRPTLGETAALHTQQPGSTERGKDSPCPSSVSCSTGCLLGTKAKCSNVTARTHLPAPVWAFPSYGSARWAAVPAPSHAAVFASTSVLPSLHWSSHPAPSVRHNHGVRWKTQLASHVSFTF